MIVSLHFRPLGLTKIKVYVHDPLLHECTEHNALQWPAGSNLQEALRCYSQPVLVQKVNLTLFVFACSDRLDTLKIYATRAKLLKLPSFRKMMLL